MLVVNHFQILIKILIGSIQKIDLTFEIVNESDNYSILAVQDLNPRDLLSQITNDNINQLKYYNFFIGSIKDVDNIIISRTGYTGELGFELYIKNKFVEKVLESFI